MNDDARRPRADDDRPRAEGDDDLAEPAGEYLARVPWEGAAPDPDVLDAATFLAWL